MPLLPIASQAYVRNRAGLPPEVCVNFYPETTPIPGRSHVNLPVPGFRQRAKLGSGPVRGIFQRDGVLGASAFIVSGTELYRGEATGTAVPIGEVPGTRRVQWAASANQLAICANGEGYVTDGATVVRITDEDLPPVSSVQYANGYFVWVASGTGDVFFSKVLDALDYQPLDFVSAEAKPDNAVGAVWDHGQLWIFGAESLQPFVQTTNPDAPFAPIPQSTREKGAPARDSIAKADNTIFFVGHDRMVYRLDGGAPRRISSFAIDELLSALTDEQAADLNAWTYVEDGHTFYGLDIPEVSVNGEARGGTYVYDVATDRWHERRSWEKPLWGGWVCERVFGSILFGSRDSGQVWALDPTEPTFDQPQVERVLTGGLPQVELRQECLNVSLDVTPGAGLLEGQGSDPLVMLSYSDDLGRTWSPERTGRLGKIGEYGHRLTWWRLKRMRPFGRVFKFRSTDPVAYAVFGARYNSRLP